MATFESMIPDVREEAQEAPDMHIEEALSRAAIDFCKDSGVWRKQLSANLKADQEEYPSADLGPPSGSRVDHLEEGWYGQRKLYDTNYEELVRASGTGPPRYFAPHPEDGFRVWPKPTSAETDMIHFMVNLVPTRDADEVPDWLADQYQDALVLRAKYRLMRVGSQPWSDPELAEMRLKQYVAKLTEAKRNAFNSRRANVQAQMRPFA